MNTQTQTRAEAAFNKGAYDAWCGRTPKTNSGQYADGHMWETARLQSKVDCITIRLSEDVWRAMTTAIKGIDKQFGVKIIRGRKYKGAKCGPERDTVWFHIEAAATERVTDKVARPVQHEIARAIAGIDEQFGVVINKCHRNVRNFSTGNWADVYFEILPGNTPTETN